MAVTSNDMDYFLDLLTVDQMRRVAERATGRLTKMAAPTVTLVPDPDDIDPDDPDYKGDPVWFCPVCGDHGVEVTDVDRSERWLEVAPTTYWETGEPMAHVSTDVDNHNETVYYLCNNGNHVVTIDPTIDITYD